MGITKYCLCCGEDVPCSTVVRNEQQEITCAYCGFTLDVLKVRDSGHAQEKGYAL
ncbi:MAG: hypothetical protein HZA17_08155, partial [Nitrospirae bacterium]|nr:hypothetical protein [Nitrospirota bacterium]